MIFLKGKSLLLCSKFSSGSPSHRVKLRVLTKSCDVLPWNSSFVTSASCHNGLLASEAPVSGPQHFLRSAIALLPDRRLAYSIAFFRSLPYCHFISKVFPDPIPTRDRKYHHPTPIYPIPFVCFIFSLKHLHTLYLYISSYLLDCPGVCLFYLWQFP